MTMNSPAELLQNTDQAYAQVKTLAEQYRNRYALTPRIAPVTDPDIMRRGAQLVQRTGSFIQTHLSETPEEIQWVLDVYRQLAGFEDVSNYTEVYDRCGILQSKTILGHCIHLTRDELALIAKRKAAARGTPEVRQHVHHADLPPVCR